MHILYTLYLVPSDIEKDSSNAMEQSVENIKKIIGEPRNYGPTPEEKAEMDRRALEEKVCCHKQ